MFLIIVALSSIALFIILTVGCIIYFSFKEKAGTGKVKPGESTDYSLKNIK